MANDFIKIDFKNTEEKTLQEERKANGRFAAIIIAGTIIILAIYHAWIRRIAVLAGILVPALIMILYGLWVIFLAKRYKHKRLLLARQLEETARQEFAAMKLAKKNNKIHLKQSKKQNHITFNKTNLEINNNWTINDSVKFKHIYKHNRKIVKYSKPSTTLHNTNKYGATFLNRNTRSKLFKLNYDRRNLTKINKQNKLQPYLIRTNSAPY